MSGDVVTLETARERIGAGVVYLTDHGTTEQGYITSVNDRYVFVRYNGCWQAQATDPERLVFLASTSSARRRA